MFKKKKRNDELDAIASLLNNQHLYGKIKMRMDGKYAGTILVDELGWKKPKFNIDNYKGKYVMYCETQEELFKFYDYLHSVGRRWSRGSSYKEFRPTETFDGKATRYIYYNNGLHGATCDDCSYIILNFKDFDWSDFNMKETKFKVGDKVKVRKDLERRHRYDNLFTVSEMEQYRGMTGVINKVDTDGHYQLDITNGKYFWSDAMLELVEEKPFTKADLEPGMVVEVRDGARYLFVNEIFVSSGGYLQFISYNDDLTHARYDCLDVVKIFNTRGTEFGNILHDHHIDLIWERKDEVKEMTVAEIEKQLGYKVKVINDKED